LPHQGESDEGIFIITGDNLAGLIFGREGIRDGKGVCRKKAGRAGSLSIGSIIKPLQSSPMPNTKKE